MSFSARLQQLCRHTRALRLAIAALLPAALLASPLAAQQTRSVPSSTYPTIQSAINASATGDTVLVSPGTYFEDLALTTKEITLTSTGGPSVTFLDGSSTHALLTIRNTPSRATTISGFTFQNGAPDIGGRINFPTGAAITLYAAGATISGNTFAHNLGPAIAGQNTSVLILNNTISTAPTSACNTFPGVTSAPVGVALAANTPYPTFPLAADLVGNTIFGDGTPCSGTAVTLDDIGDPVLLWNNTLRNNSTALTTNHVFTVDNVTLFQNLIYDNAAGALQFVNFPVEPPPGPPSIHILNNTISNNLTSQPNSIYIADIVLQDTFERAEFVNNLLVGTTSRPVLQCRLALSTDPTPTPVILDHNDLFNTSSGPILSGPCTAALSSNPLYQLSQNGNLSTDPQLTGSTDLHPLAGSPALDSGNNSALRLILPPAAPAPSLTSLLPSDIAGSPRLADSTGKGTPIVDLGAYERTGSTTALTPTALDVTPASFSPGSSPTSATITIRAADGTLPAGTLTLLLNGTAVSSAAASLSGPTTLTFTPTGTGLFALTATFSPTSSAYAPSTSVVRYVSSTATAPTVATQTTLTLSASPSTQTLNQPITLSAHLGSTTTSNGTTTTPGPVPPGALALSQDGAFLTTLQPDSTGLSTYTIPQPGLGPHTWTVTYAGTSTYPSATASTSATVLAPTATTATASISPSPAPEGAPVTLSASVASTSGTTTPTGSLIFSDGATSLASVPLSAGSASFTTSTLSLGTHTITFTYTPDSGFSPSSTTRSVTIGGVSTTTTLSASPNPAAPNAPVQLTTSTSTQQSPAQTPTGSISLSDGATLLFSGPISPNTPALVTTQTFTTPGTHHLVATFTPATNAWLTSTTTLDLIVTASPTISGILSPSSTTVPYGGDLTFNSAFTPASALPSGATVTLLEDGAAIAAQQLTAGNTLSLGYSGVTFPVGTHQFSETLTTAQGTLLSTTNTVLITITGPTSTLVLTANPSPSASAGTSVSLTATVTTAHAPAAATLSGAITFLDGTAVLGLAPLSPAGTATLSLSTLAPGTHILTATWTGTALLPSATASPISETITAIPSATTLTLAPAATTAFSPVLLSAHVGAATSPTGTVTFFSGAAELAQALLDLNGNASASLALPAGNYTVTAVFSGTGPVSSSSSAAASLTITPVTGSLALTGTASALTLGSSLGLTATYTLPSPLPNLHPVGTVTFLDGSTPFATVPLSANGSASLTNTPTSVGLHTITATYSGDLNDTPASATLTFTVLAVPAPTQDFSVAVAAPSMSIQTTHHSSTTVTITTTGPFADTLQLSCADLPAIASCTFSPTTLHVGSTTAATGATSTYTATLALDTDFILNWAHNTPPTALPRNPLARALPLLALLLPAPLLWLGRRHHPRLPRLLAAILCCGLALSLSACGNKQPGHTDPGTYTIHVVAHANGNNTDRTATLQLTVTP